MSQFPLFYVLLFSEYGKNMVVTLAKHYYPDPGDTINRQQLLDEWQKAKYDLLQWKENDLPQTICEGTGSITATDWCLSKLLQPTYRSHYPMLSFIAEVCSSCPVSNAWPERAGSVLKWQKSRLRSRLKNDLLNPLLHITINGPKQESKELPLLIKEVVEEWLKEKDRRKFKRLPPISTNASTTSTPPISSHSITDQVTVDEDEDDLPLLGTEDADDTMPSSSGSSLPEHAQEPSYDAYVAALQLQDCDDCHSHMGDSDYESDYFSD